MSTVFWSFSEMGPPTHTHTFILLSFLPNDYNWMIPGLSLQRVFQKNIQREAGSRVSQLTADFTAVWP